MKSLDETLRDTIRSAGPALEDVTGDVTRVHQVVRRRRVQRRAFVGASLATVLAVAVVFIVNQDDDGSRVVTHNPPTSETTDTQPPSTDPSTTTSSAPPATGGTTSTTEPEVPTTPPITSIAFGSMTYSGICAPFDDRDITLENGRATVPLGPGVALRPQLDAVGDEADADGDGDADAIVLITCAFTGANVDTSGWLGSFRVGADGRAEMLGAPVVVEHVHEREYQGGLRVRVTRDVYGPDDAACCPSAGAEDIYVFADGGFRLESTRDIPPPGAG